MYGTVARVRVKEGRLHDLMAVMEEWDRDFKPRVRGAIGSLTYKLDEDPNELFLCAIFKDKASYTTNADDPEQDKWYQRMRECLTADPEWNDGEIISYDL